MNLDISYMGLELAHPLIVGASPLADDLDTPRRLEDAGAAAIVMRSLFQEQIEGEQYASAQQVEMYADSFSEASSFFPATDDFAMNPYGYLEHVRRLKAALRIPVIASLNGLSTSGWLRYARLIEQAGADALELNVYHVSTNLWETAATIEENILESARTVREAVKIPLAIKLSPFFTSVPHLAMQLRTAGVDGLVLFNRFYQPDIDLGLLSVVPQLHLSDSSELQVRLRWLAILSGRITASLAVSGGVHTGADAVKAVMAGAHAVQIVSAILKNGPAYLKTLLTDFKQWMEENGYQSVRQMRGSLDMTRCPDPAAFERGNYMRVLNSWRETPRFSDGQVPQ
ncbi:MAG: dihydroorotate dehydrogenase-like protein [Tepidisphaeraceae bacterium]|jgi:dihydroorotate dehydrogenase (fumarate)